MNNERIFRTRSDEKLTPEEIRLLVERFIGLSEHYRRMDDYYKNRNHGIFSYDKNSDPLGNANEDKVPDNKVPHAFAKYISDTLTDYFLGQPVVYGVDADGSQEMLDKLQECFDYNDEQNENFRLGLMASINGVAYEMLYLDEDGKARFTPIDPQQMFVVYDASVEDKLVCAIRTYTYDMYDGETVRYYECYDKDETRHFIRDNLGFRELEDMRTPNYFGDVPIIVYENNDYWTGDFEPVIPQIDAYDKLQSNTLNDMEYFTDAYLKIRNMSGTDADDLREMRKMRAFKVDDNGDVDWLIKNVNDTWVENMKTRVQHDIHKFSGTPDMTDESFGSNLSGVSLKYKLMGMEHIRAGKERCFKKGLQRRIELLSYHLRLRSVNDLTGYTAITMTFNNTLPQNLEEQAQIVSTLSSILSEETLLSLLPFVEDPQAEMERKEKEQEEAADANYARFMVGNAHDVTTEDEETSEDVTPEE